MLRGGAIAQTPSRLLREAYRYEAAADISAIPPPPEGSDATETTHTQPESPTKPDMQVKRAVLPVQDENTPAQELYTPILPPSTRTVRPEKSKSPSSGLRSSPSARSRRPLGERAGSQPIVERGADDDDQSSANYSQRSRSPSLPPELGERDDDSDLSQHSDTSTRSHGSTGRGWRRAGRSPKVPALSASIDSSGSSEGPASPPGLSDIAEERHGGPQILTASRVQVPPSSEEDDEDEDRSHEVLAAPILPPPLTPASIASPNSSPLAGRDYRSHAPVNPSGLRNVSLYSSAGGSSSSRASSPIDSEEASPARQKKQMTASPLASEIATPRAARKNPMAQYVMATLEKNSHRSTSINSAPRARLNKAPTPFRRAAPFAEEDSTGSYTSEESSGSGISYEYANERRDQRNLSMPIESVDDAGLHGRLNGPKIFKAVQKMNDALENRCNVLESEKSTALIENAELRHEILDLRQQLEETRAHSLEGRAELQSNLSGVHAEADSRIDDGARGARLLEATFKRSLQEKDEKIRNLEQSLRLATDELQERRLQLEQGASSPQERRQAADLRATEDLQAALRRAFADIEKANRARSDEQGRRERADSDLLQANEAMQELHRLLSLRDQSLELKEAELDERKLEWTRLSEEFAEMQKDLHAVAAERDELEAAFDMALADRVAEERARAREAETNAQRLMAQVDELRQDQSEQRLERARGSPIRDDLHKLISEANELRQMLDAKEEELANARSSLAARNDQLDNAKYEIERLRADYECEDAVAGKRKVGELQAQVDSLKRQVEAFQSPAGLKSILHKSMHSIMTPAQPEDFLSLMYAKSPLYEKSVALEAEVDTLKKEIVRLRQQLAQLNDSHDDKVAQLEEMLATREGLARELEQARSRLDQLEHTHEPLEPTFDESKAEGAGNLKDAREMSRELQRAHRENQRIHRTLQSMRDKLDKVREERDESTHMRDASSNEVEKLRQELGELQRRLHTTEQLKADRNAALKTLQSVSDRCEHLQYELEQARSDKARLAAVHHQQVDQIEQLGRDLQAVRLDADDINRQLGGVTARLRTGGTVTRQEAKSLLLYIGYLRTRCTREANFRAQLLVQKRHLQNEVTRRQNDLGATRHTLKKFGLDYPAAAPSRPTFRTVARAIVALMQLRRDSVQWRTAERVKFGLRDSWEKSRGRPWGTTRSETQ